MAKPGYTVQRTPNQKPVRGPIYVVKDDNDYFTGNKVRYWSNVKKDAATFASKEEAKKAVIDSSHMWVNAFMILFMHPYNLNPA